MSQKGVAFFDFDGTITPKDSFLEFIRFTHGSFRLYTCILLNLPFILLYYINKYPNQYLKERFFAFFYKGETKETLETLGNKFATSILPKLCYPSAMKIIEWHKSEGHDIYLLTASSNIWLDAWCRANEIILIGTSFEVREGKYTGKLEGNNCYGENKLERIKPLLNKYQLSHSYGYGDSQSDNFYLNALQHSYLMPLSKSNVKHKWKN